MSSEEQQQLPPVTFADFKAWLAEHGQDTKNVRTVEFVPTGVHSENGVQLRIERYALDESGKRFVDLTPGPRRGNIALEVVWMPLKRLPGLPKEFDVPAVGERFTKKVSL